MGFGDAVKRALAAPAAERQAAPEDDEKRAEELIASWQRQKALEQEKAQWEAEAQLMREHAFRERHMLPVTDWSRVARPWRWFSK